MISVSGNRSIRNTVRLSLLLLVSLFFYACFGLPSLLCVLVLSAVTWSGGILAEHSRHPSVPVTVSLLLLLAVWFSQKRTGIFLLGISFYLLQAIGYLLDIRNDTGRAERNPFYLLLFLSFFPLSIQGPIWRYPDFRRQLDRSVCYGISGDTPVAAAGRQGAFGRILWGAFKKLVIADRIGLMTSVLFASPEVYRGFYVLLALISYTIQLYMDFTGGIDMALGAARCLGFTLPENFDRPFAACSLAEFWRRWHITLGSWFRDYVFYPLSLSDCWGRLLAILPGNSRHKNMPSSSEAKTGSAQTTLAVWGATLITWALTGLWHGLEPRFLLWGLLNGLILLLTSRRKTRDATLKRVILMLRKCPPLRMAGIFLLTSLLRTLDCYPDIRTAAKQVLSLVKAIPSRWGLQGAPLLPGLKTADILLLLVCLLLFLLFRQLFRRAAQHTKQKLPGEQNFFTLTAWLCQLRFGWQLYCLGCAMLLIVTLLFGVYGQGYDATGFIYGNFI